MKAIKTVSAPHKTVHAEAMIQVAMIRLMAARLAGEELPAPTSAVEVEAARRLAEDHKT